MKTVFVFLVILSLNLFSQTGRDFNLAGSEENQLNVKNYFLTEDLLKLLTLDSLITIIDNEHANRQSRSLIYLELRGLEEYTIHSVIIATNDKNNYLLFIKNENELSFLLFNKKQRSVVTYSQDDWWLELKKILNNNAKVVVVK